VVSAAVVVQVGPEAQRLVQAPHPDAPELRGLALRVPLRLPLRTPEPVPPVRARLPAAADAVVEREARVHRRSRQSCSAAMARSSPSPAPPTYEPVLKSR
jgi:hypothetical protein